MYTIFIIDVFSHVLLIGALFWFWKERKHFYLLRPLLPAFAFLAIDHIAGLPLKHPNIRLSDYFLLPVGSVELVLATVGDIASNMGVTFLIYGFIKMIKYKQAEKKHIQELEQMLPLCSNCKKYRTENGQWLPVEKFLIDSGAPRLTHGICPECSEKRYDDILNKNKHKRRNGFLLQTL